MRSDLQIVQKTRKLESHSRKFAGPGSSLCWYFPSPAYYRSWNLFFLVTRSEKAVRLAKSP